MPLGSPGPRFHCESRRFTLKVLPTVNHEATGTPGAASELLYDMWGDADALIERVDDFTDPKRQERARINSVRRSLWLEGRVAPLMLLVNCHLRHSLRGPLHTSLVSEVGAPG
jgi:hypothetical protein